MRKRITRVGAYICVIAMLLSGMNIRVNASEDSSLEEGNVRTNTLQLERENQTGDPNEGNQEETEKADITIGNVVSPPDKLTSGTSITLKGTISSAANLTSVHLKIISRDGNKVHHAHSVQPNDKNHTIDATANQKLPFHALPVGEYTYVLTASNADGRTKELVTKHFTVVEKADIIMKNGAYPSAKLAFGSSVTLKGTVSSAANLTAVSVKVTSQDGKKTYYNYTVKPNNRTYHLDSKVNQKVKFQTLPLGSYKYVVTASNTDGRTKEVVSHRFQVTGKKSSLKISSKLSAAKIYKGKNTRLSGKITSNYKISSITIEVLNTKHKKTVKPNKTSYSISKKVSNSLKFYELPKGTHSIKITVKDVSGKTLTKILKLKVIRYDKINYKIRGIKQRTYSDCAFASMATCEYYNETKGRGKHGKRLIRSKDPYATMKRLNGNSTFGIWSNINYSKSYSTSASALYQALKRGPVIVHKRNGYRTHYSVVYAYTGSDNQLSLSKFKVYEVTNGKTLSMSAWLGRKTSTNINGPGHFDHLVAKR